MINALIYLCQAPGQAEIRQGVPVQNGYPIGKAEEGCNDDEARLYRFILHHIDANNSM